MRFQFKSKALLKLFKDGKNAHHYDEKVIDAFFIVMAIIDSAKNENDIREFKSLHFEKLRGKRGNDEQHSLRLFGGYRLIVRIEDDPQGKFFLIIEIIDYHG